MNRIAAGLFESSPEALIGRRRVSDLFDEPGIEPTAVGEPLQRWETQIRTEHGLVIPVEIVREPLGTIIAGAHVYAVRDLRERREIAAERERKNRALEQRERELSVQNLRFDTAINNMPQGLAMLDGQQRLLVSNARFGDLLGLAPGLLVPGATLASLLQSSPVLKSADGGFLGEFGAGTHHLACGKVLSVAQRPMPDGGTVITTEDITERECDKRRLEDYTVKLERSNQDLQSFAYVASHDLQEPLRKIETFADRIRRRHAAELPEEAATSLERMHDAARRMRRLINDLLGYARLESSSNAFVRVSLDEILQGVLSDLQIRVEECDAKIVGVDLPSLHADPTQMRQLFQNLLSNSLKFTRKGVAPRIEVRGKVRSAPDQGERVVITFTDNGIGFDNQFKNSIFKVFQRLHGRSEYEGTGLGLATCRKIVDRHGGTIDADGRPGEGATFTVELPLARNAGA